MTAHAITNRNNRRPAEFLKTSAENYVGDAMEYYGAVNGPKRLGANDRDLESGDFDEIDAGQGE